MFAVRQPSILGWRIGRNTLKSETDEFDIILENGKE